MGASSEGFRNAVFASFAGALAGTVIACVSSLPFREWDVLVITAPIGFLAGAPLGLVAQMSIAPRWMRRLVLSVIAPFMVLVAAFAWGATLDLIEGKRSDGFLIFLAIGTAVIATPGTTLGAFILEALIAPPDPSARFRVHALLRRLEQGRSAAPVAIAALDDRSSDVRRTAARWIVEHLASAASTLGDWATRAEAAHVPDVARELAKQPAAAEEMLLAALERGDWKTQSAAIVQLGDVGGMRAFRALRALRDLGFDGSGIHFALEKIGRRLPAAERGQLSIAIAADPTGRLSAPGAAGGRLSNA